MATDKTIIRKLIDGYKYYGKYVNEKTINYVTKYMTKEDADHPGFIGKVLCSKGIGEGYTKRIEAKKHVYKKGETIEHYRLRNGSKINLPVYYRNQLFTEEEREMLFLDKIDKGIIYVMKQKVHRDDEEYYLQLREEGRRTEQRIYGNHAQEWEQQKYLN